MLLPHPPYIEPGMFQPRQHPDCTTDDFGNGAHSTEGLKSLDGEHKRYHV